LSRFDAIFIVKDIREDKLDKAIASHVLALHMHGKLEDKSNEGEIQLEFLRKYCCYAKTKVQPKLSEEAC
jgi:DNA replicative helicase MCM subunit Mcm2 (Cdc46/Mcm family)